MIRTKRAKRHSRRRDFKAEYRRRIAKGIAKGLSKSQSRGHPRASEIQKSSNLNIDLNNPAERAVRRMKAGETLKSAANNEGISKGRLRRYLAENVEASRESRRWKIVDHRPVELAICSRAKFCWVTVSTDQSGLIGLDWNAVNRFLRSNDSPAQRAKLHRRPW